MEMLQQVADLDYVFVQVGGGGLAAGVAILLKQFMPEIKVIGVESKDSACLNAALEKVNLPIYHTLAYLLMV